MKMVKSLVVCAVALTPVYGCNEKSSKKDKTVQQPTEEDLRNKTEDEDKKEEDKKEEDKKEEDKKEEDKKEEDKKEEDKKEEDKKEEEGNGGGTVVTPNPNPNPEPSPVPTPNPEPTPNPDPGLAITSNRPLITQIAPDVEPATDWEPDQEFQGREYWLYSTRGRPMSLMTFDAEENYSPYDSESRACEGASENANSPCNLKPGNVAKQCQRIASKTLKAIMETDNEAMKLFNEIEAKYATNSDAFEMFGWQNDAYSDPGHGLARVPQDLFIWRSEKQNVSSSSCPSDFKKVRPYTYIKWVSSVSKTGECKSPSLGQFVVLLKAAKECLEKNNAPNN